MSIKNAPTPFQIIKKGEGKKLTREMKGVDSSDMDYRDPLFRARANVSNYETEYAQRMNPKFPRR